MNGIVPVYFGMKLIKGLLLLLVTCGSASAQQGDPLLFQGTTPCNNLVKPLNKIATEPDCKWHECGCALIEWKLTLYTDPVTRQPTTYKLSSINRSLVKETNLFSEPGVKSGSEGKWTIIRGTKTNANAVIYQLSPDNAAVSLSFVRLNDRLIHALDPSGNLMTGNEFWSYTLNRIP